MNQKLRVIFASCDSLPEKTPRSLRLLKPKNRVNC